jgi:prepilin signal peptidase PulO-like enzyme (type II secretory pathway)
MAEIFTWIVIALLGWLTGVLVNYLADILPIKRRFGAPICVACHDPMPVVNYLFWPRRCPECWSRRSWRTWVVELFFTVAAVWFWINPPNLLGFWPGMVLLAFLGVVFVIDMEYRLILHPVSIFGAVLGLVLGISMRGLWITLLGGAAGYGIMLGLYWFGGVFAKWLARRRGEVLTEVALGFGDVNLAGILGLLLGWPGIVAGLLLTIIIGGVISILYLLLMVILRRYHTFMAIPYGPFMVISVVLLLYFQMPV